MPDEVIHHCDVIFGGAEGGIWTRMLNDFKNNKLEKNMILIHILKKN